MWFMHLTFDLPTVRWKLKWNCFVSALHVTGGHSLADASRLFFLTGDHSLSDHLSVQLKYCCCSLVAVCFAFSSFQLMLTGWQILLLQKKGLWLEKTKEICNLFRARVSFFTALHKVAFLICSKSQLFYKLPSANRTTQSLHGCEPMSTVGYMSYVGIDEIMEILYRLKRRMVLIN